MNAITSKEYFPTLVNNPDMLYFDSAATSQTHSSVLKAMTEYYTEYRGTYGRGSSRLTDRVTQAVDSARSSVASLMHGDPENVIFTRGATDGLNRIAEWCRGAPVVAITEAEHNANVAPWLAQGRTVENGRLVILPVAEPESGTRHNPSVKDHWKSIIDSLPSGSHLSLSLMSNVCGIIPDSFNTDLFKGKNLTVTYDATQFIPNAGFHASMKYATWVVASAHKMYGPTGTGFIYSREHPSKLRPLQFGGGNVENVHFNGFDLSSDRHLTGTPDIANIIGMGVACDLIDYVGFDDITDHKMSMSAHLHTLLQGDPIAGLTLAYNSGGLSTFIPKHDSSADIAEILRETPLVVRTGRVCAHAFVDKISNGRGIVRLSYGLHNTKQELTSAVDCIREVMHTLSRI